MGGHKGEDVGGLDLEGLIIDSVAGRQPKVVIEAEQEHTLVEGESIYILITQPHIRTIKDQCPLPAGGVVLDDVLIAVTKAAGGAVLG